ALSRIARRADHAERGTVARSGKRACVAMSHDARAVGDDRRTVARDCAIDLDIVEVNLSRQIKQRLGFRPGRAAAVLRVALADALDRPEQVDRGGTAGGEYIERVFQRRIELRA